MLLAATFFWKVKTGISVDTVRNLYCSVGIDCMTADPWLRPNSVLSAMAEFRINMNCSAQLELVGSFHDTIWLDRFLPLPSITSSVVATLANFSNPLADLQRLALYPSSLANLRTLSFLSASSMKFSLLARSIRKLRLCPRNAMASIRARYSELSM